MEAKRLVVIGLGPAGLALLKRLDQRGVLANTSIVAVHGGSRLVADKLAAMEAALVGRSLDDHPLDAWCATRGIKLHLGQTVVDWDRREQWVATESGSRHSYDICVLATGWMPQAVADNPVSLFTVDDALQVGRRLAASSESNRPIRLVGTGWFTLWVAGRLDAAGWRPVLSGSEGRWCSDRLPPSGELQLQNLLRGLGWSDDQATCPTAVELPRASADDRLARRVGLECAPDGGVMVDSWLRTSDPLVRAIGGFAVSYGRRPQSPLACQVMAECLADQLTDELSGQSPGRQYFGDPEPFRLEFGGLRLETDGLRVADVPGAREVAHSAPGLYRGLVVRGARVIGRASLMPQSAEEPFADAEREQLLTARQIRVWRSSGRLDAAYAWWQRRRDGLICHCRHVSEAELLAAIEAGDSQLAELRLSTGATTGCGTCRQAVLDLLQAHSRPPAS